MTARPLIGALVALAVAAATPAPASEVVEHEIPGPEGGWSAVSLAVGDAEIRVQVLGPDDTPGPSAILSWRDQEMELLGPDEVPSHLPALQATVDGQTLSLTSPGEPPGSRANLTIDLLVAPGADVGIRGWELDLEVSGPWVYPKDVPQEEEERPAGKKGRRRRGGAAVNAAEPPPFPPAPARMQVQGDRARIDVSGWPGSLEVRGERAEVSGENLGGALEMSPGRGDVELTGVGGTVRTRRERSGVSLDTLHARAHVEVEGGDVWLARCEKGVLAKVSGGQLVLQEIAVRADVRVEDGTLDVNGLEGHLGGNTAYTEVTLQRIIGTVALSTREGRLLGSDLIGQINLESEATEIELKGINGRARVSAGWAPATFANLQKGLQLTVEQAEVSIEDVRLELKVTQEGGSLQARGITGIPELQLTEVELDYRHGGRLPQGGSMTIRGGTSKVKVPQQTRLLLLGDEHRIRTTLGNQSGSELDDPTSAKGIHLTFDVEGGDVEVDALP